MKSIYHIPVLSKELGENVSLDEGSVLVDATFGGGGHSEMFLKKGVEVIAFDRDEEVLEEVNSLREKFPNSFHFSQKCFSQMREVLADREITSVDGIIADLGVSSRQLENAERGFSFLFNGPLDMRMSQSSLLNAFDIVNHWKERDLRDLFFRFGEERKSSRLAHEIVKRRKEKFFEDTLELADFVSSFFSRNLKRHPATQIFQALRIAVNKELEELEFLLEIAPSFLAPRGFFAVMSFHSLEDRLVKQAFRKRSAPFLDAPNFPAPLKNKEYCFDLLTKRPIVPAEEEILHNPRARSAKLRIVQKISSDS